MTESDFRKKIFSGRKYRKYAGKTGFLAFSRGFISCFSWFFAQRCVLAMLIIWPSRIFEKNFFRPKIPEICRKSPVLQIFIRRFPNISLVFHTKTLRFQKTRNKYDSKTFLHNGIEVWNNLPNDLRQTQSIVTFKSKAKSHFFQ